MLQYKIDPFRLAWSEAATFTHMNYFGIKKVSSLSSSPKKMSLFWETCHWNWLSNQKCISLLLGKPKYIWHSQEPSTSIYFMIEEWWALIGWQITNTTSQCSTDSAKASWNCQWIANNHTNNNNHSKMLQGLVTKLLKWKQLELSFC